MAGAAAGAPIGAIRDWGVETTCGPPGRGGYDRRAVIGREARGGI